MDRPVGGSRRRLSTQPAVDETETAATDAKSSTVTNAPWRALVVEAEPITLGVCRDALERAGFIVDAVDSGIAAVVAAREAVPDVIFIDLQLRDVPGREAIAWLRCNPVLRSTPIIVFTDNREDEAGLAMARPGTSLRKPISPVMLQHAIREVLE